MVTVRINSNPIHYRPLLLGVAALCSFTSATWAAANPGWLWWGRDDFHIPVVLLVYTTFFTIFIAKAVVEWRLETRIPFRVECAYIGFAWCAQFVAIVLEHVGKPYQYDSEWSGITCFSWLSLIALTAYAALPVHSKIGRIILFILLPPRLRKSLSPDASPEEPIPPAYSTLPIGILEVILEEGPVDSEELVQSDLNNPKATKKGGYTLLPADDLERGGQ